MKHHKYKIVDVSLMTLSDFTKALASTRSYGFMSGRMRFVVNPFIQGSMHGGTRINLV